MKKMIIILLIVLLAGVLLAVIGFVIAYNQVGNLEEKNASFDYYSGDNLTVDCTTSNVYVTVGEENGKVKFKFNENNNIKATVAKNGSDISFIIDKKSNFFIWNAFLKKTTVEVTVPKNFSGNVTLKTNTGKLDLNASGVDIHKLEAVIGTGDMSINNAAVSDSATIKSSTGKIVVNDLSVANGLTVTGTTGDVSLNNLTVGGDLSSTLTTGYLDVKEATIGGSLTLTATTGKLSASADAKNVELKTTTGKISFTLKNADSVLVKATTGDVVGKIYGSEADYAVSANTTTGESNLGKHAGKVENKIFNAQTTTGDIFVEFVE